MQQTTTYKAAGVDIDAGNLFTRMIKEKVREAWPENENQIGGFAGGGPIPDGAKIVKASTDGTGTKAIIASAIEMFDGLGEDAVAMSAVDAYVSGAHPAYLLDTLDVGRLNPIPHIKIIESLIRGCKKSGCRLIGGETAEMPDIFKYPWMVNINTVVIGFEGDIPGTKQKVEPGQKVYAWPSHGPASNGFSLIRKIFDLKTSRPKIRKSLERHRSELDTTLAEAILRPTPIWIENIEEEKKRGVIFTAHAHITGGGMVENIPRILSQKLKVVIDRARWHRPPIFRLIEEIGNVSAEEMDRVFNQGVMMISIVTDEGVAVADENAIHIGQVEKKQGLGIEPQVEFLGCYNE